MRYQMAKSDWFEEMESCTAGSAEASVMLGVVVRGKAGVSLS